MLMRSIGLTFLAVLLAGAPLLVSAQVDVRPLEYLPADLREHAKQLGCSGVPGAFEERGMVLPPYVYGVLPGDEHESAAFWCKKADKFLLAVVAEQEKKLACPRVLEFNQYLGGLALAKNRRIPLSKFYYMDTKNRGPKDQTTNYTPLRAEWSGTYFLFYCHKGKWMSLGVD
jgi:hypothetical protein